MINQKTIDNISAVILDHCLDIYNNQQKDNAMKYPAKSKLNPLARQYADDMGYKILSSGRVTNGRKGLKHFSWKNLYELGLSLYRGGFIIRIGSDYRFITKWCSRPYPYTIDAKIKAEAMA